MWDFTDGSGNEGIGCHGLDTSGALTTQNQVTLSTNLADVATIAPLSSGDFAIAWQIHDADRRGPHDHRAGRLHDARLRANRVDEIGSNDGPHRASIADNESSVLYTWLTDGAVHSRASTPTGTFSGADTVLFPPPTGFVIEQARVAVMGTGFGVAVREVTTDGTTGGQIQLVLTNAAGQVLPGMPVTISTQTGADFSVGAQGFGIATRRRRRDPDRVATVRRRLARPVHRAHGRLRSARSRERCARRLGVRDPDDDDRRLGSASPSQRSAARSRSRGTTAAWRLKPCARAIYPAFPAGP